jgi:RNA polymerase sigma factor (sigma-70 family)
MDHGLYKDIEKLVMPMIRRKAARLGSIMDVDDAIQEARIVLFKALKSYEYNRQPDITRYVSVCLTNAFNTLYRKETARRRSPHVYTMTHDHRGLAKGWTSIPVPVNELDESVHNSGAATPEEVVEYKQAEGTIAALLSSIEDKLSLRDRLVLWTYMVPPAELGEFPTNLEVADHLGLTKNMLDWSLHKIRKHLLAAMRGNAVDERFVSLISGHGWPFVATFDSWDAEDTRELLDERELSTEVLSTTMKVHDGIAVKVDQYRWGTIHCIRSGDDAVTVLMVGRYNSATNMLFGSVCGCESVPVEWYTEHLKAAGGGS